MTFSDTSPLWGARHSGEREPASVADGAHTTFQREPWQLSIAYCVPLIYDVAQPGQPSILAYYVRYNPLRRAAAAWILPVAGSS